MGKPDAQRSAQIWMLPCTCLGSEQRLATHQVSIIDIKLKIPIARLPCLIASLIEVRAAIKSDEFVDQTALEIQVEGVLSDGQLAFWLDDEKFVFFILKSTLDRDALGTVLQLLNQLVRGYVEIL